MAASIYATPPPDLIGEDTGLSDSSNSTSPLPSNTTSATNGLLVDDADKSQPLDSTGPNGSFLNTELFDGSDAAKKRRKQTTPLRHQDSNGEPREDGEVRATSEDVESNAEKVKLIETNLLMPQKMDGGLLDNLDIVQRAALLISQLHKSQKKQPTDLNEALPTDLSVGQQNNGDESDSESQKGQMQMANLKLLMSEIMDNKDCSDCGAKFDSNLKLKMHIFQEHGHSVMRGDEGQGGDSAEQNMHRMMGLNAQQHLGGKPEDWMNMAGLPFPYPHDGSSYLPQLPMLGGMSSQMGQFMSSGGSNMDALSRPGPPLRIFNPEAYCDLCNKEFCNKYFLKTHRANKHGIYENSSNASDSSTSNSASAPPPTQGVPNPPAMLLSMVASNSSAQPMLTEGTSNGNGNLMPGDGTVHCDVCMKKFANTFAMKRHRTKAHETSPSSADKSDQNPMSNIQSTLEGDRSIAIRFPEDFRPDYSVEQEDTSFTPQPRKLSPVSSQQARESNFSADKLKRLGVLNPEAFCEICCKEYCNKYFLRTHKLKRHGILMPPDEMKDVMADKNPWQFLQANPLNLMLGGDFNPIQQLQQKFLNEMTGLASRKQGPSKSPDTMIGGDDKQETSGSLGKFDEEDASKKSSDGKDKGSSANSPSSSPNADQQADVDAISMDLQKLQSMILQLNDLNASHSQIIPCNLCGKELENQYLFHAHLMAEHGHMTEGMLNLKSKSGSVSPSNSQPSFSQLHQQLIGGAGGGSANSGSGQQTEFCKQCDKEFGNAAEFKQHLFEAHGLAQRSGSVSPVREGFVTPDRPTTINASSSNGPAPPTGDRRPPYAMTPTSSYCEICNKELCNKYFMKTHMQRMHGIEIENGSQIGGVVCNICNKELCSKYFLRVHKHNTHGIIEDGAPLPPQIAAKVANGEAAAAAAAAAAAVAASGSSGPAPNSEQSEEVCPLCTRRFRSAKWLRAHLMSDHGKAGIDRLKELEQRMNLSKSNPSPTLKIPNGSFPGMLNNVFVNDADPMKQFVGMNPGLMAELDDSNNNNNSGASGGKMKEYQCSFCAFSTPYYAFLFIHERSHSLMHPNVNNAILRNVSPMMPSALASGLLNEFGQFKDDFRGISAQHPFASQSESAVSIAKDLFPNHSGQPMAASITPSSTPASTPGVGSGMAETNNRSSNDVDLVQPGDSDEDEREQPPRKKSRSSRSEQGSGARADNFLRKFSMGGDAIPMGRLSKLESSHMLKDMANLTKRPAIYALPKESEPMIMQSFLIEESRSRGGDKRKLNDVEDAENRNRQIPEEALALVMANNNNTNNSNMNGELRKSAPNSSEDYEGKNRFVPAVVFLPVRERISTPVTISFTLTPA